MTESNRGDSSQSFNAATPPEYPGWDDIRVRPSVRIARLEKAVETIAWWLVEAQTGFSSHDAREIVRILKGER